MKKVHFSLLCVSINVIEISHRPAEVIGQRDIAHNPEVFLLPKFCCRTIDTAHSKNSSAFRPSLLISETKKLEDRGQERFCLTKARLHPLINHKHNPMPSPQSSVEFIHGNSLQQGILWMRSFTYLNTIKTWLRWWDNESAQNRLLNPCRALISPNMTSNKIGFRRASQVTHLDEHQAQMVKNQTIGMLM